MEEGIVREEFRGPDLEILGTGSWTLGGQGFEQSSNGLRLGPTPVASAYGPSTEGGTVR